MGRKLRISVIVFLVTVAGFSVFDTLYSQPTRCRDCFSVEFRDVELRDFLKAMATNIRRNIMVDDSVKGKITIISYQDIPRSRALEFLKQVLEVRGYAVLEEGDFIKVVAADVARNSIMPVEENPDANDAGIVSRVIQLPGGANINEITNIAKNIAGNNTSVVPYRPTNTLVITGYVSSVRRALSVLDELVEQMKQASPGGTVGGGESVHIYRAKHMTAESLAGVLVRLDNPQIPVTAPEGAQQNGEGGEQPQQQVQPVAQQAPGGKIKAVAHKESNSIVVTASPGEWNEILSIIQTLDQPRHQILLEVLIAEVTSSSLNDFGIDWRYQGTDSAHSQFNTGLAVEGNLVDTETGQITGNNTLNGFSLGFLEKNGDLLAILNANISNQNFNVLS
ncbi:MAG: hypothetical protein KDK30_10600, partial [Leptospiraceae bacterium]|nr:hypothetical protein [Leptospiraceae bacterium]